MNIIAKIKNRLSASTVPTLSNAIINIDSENYSRYSGSAYGNAAFCAAVDTIARHTAKLHAHCKSDRVLEGLFQIRPNQYMSAFDMLYKTATAFYTHNNAFILLQRDPLGRVSEIYPIVPTGIEFKTGANSEIYAVCLFSDGKTVTLPYSDIIHLRRHFLEKDLLGDENRQLFEVLDIAQTLNQGIVAATKNATGIRGVLKFTSLVNPETLKKEKDAFIRDYFNASDGAGIAATDNRFEFQPVDNCGYSIPSEQVSFINKQIYDYLGVSEKVVNGSYSEDEFSAFYESVIEPFAVQLSQEIRIKCGAEVVFSSERLEFSSAKTKISLLEKAMPMGILTINEARTLLNLPEIADGEKRLMSLNYIDAAKANEYQGVAGDEQKNDSDSDSENDSDNDTGSHPINEVRHSDR